MDFDRDIKEDVKISRFSLDIEAEEHPSIYWYWSDQLVEAKKDRDQLKADYKSKIAEIEMDYRADNIPLDIKKTEASISAAVENHPDVKKARQKYLDSEYIVNKLQSAEESLRQKKSMLDNLIQLYTMQYYSEPKAKHHYDTSDQVSDEIRKSKKRKSKEI